MNVLSLFDGISCGMLALQRANISVEQYFSSEIDTKAITISNDNFPNIVRLGDIREWKKWQLPTIDLLLAGSPCTGFSKAGKGLNFEDPQSILFFQFVDILNHLKPKFFLLENVVMKKEFRDIISNILKVQPIEIDSALVSAQRRKRLYWTNIPNISIPEDRGIQLDKVVYTIPHGYMPEKIDFYDKYPTLVAQSPGSKHKIIDDYELLEYAKSRVNERLKNKNGLVYSWYMNKIHIEKYPTSTTNNGCWSGTGGIIVIDKNKMRTLAPEECESLQTLPIGYTKSVNKTARYKAIGNGWTVDVISHILKNLQGDS